MRSQISKTERKRKKKDNYPNEEFQLTDMKIWMISKFRFNKKNGHPNQLGVKAGMIQNDKKK